MDRPLIPETTLRAANTLVGKGASLEELAEAELMLGVHIAGEYRRFLRAMGWISSDSVEIFGLGVDVPRHLDLVAITTRERTDMYPPLPADFLPLANDGSGNLYCIRSSVTTMTEPVVVLWDHEMGPDQQPSVVASSFSLWAEEATARVAIRN